MRFVAIWCLLWATSATAEQLPPDLAPYAKDLPVVQLVTDRDLDLEFLADSQQFQFAALSWPLVAMSSETWRHACATPCNEPHYRRAIYRVAGDGIVTSRHFTLPRRGQTIKLYVTPGSVAVRRGAWATFAIGLVAATVGGVVMAASPLYGPTDASNALLIGSSAPAGLGLSLLLTSIPLFVKSRTLVTAESQ